jgi:hypothetical protein
LRLALPVLACARTSGSRWRFGPMRAQTMPIDDHAIDNCANLRLTAGRRLASVPGGMLSRPYLPGLRLMADLVRQGARAGRWLTIPGGSRRRATISGR